MVEKLRQYAAQENRTLSKMTETIFWLFGTNGETEEKNSPPALVQAFIFSWFSRRSRRSPFRRHTSGRTTRPPNEGGVTPQAGR